MPAGNAGIFQFLSKHSIASSCGRHFLLVINIFLSSLYLFSSWIQSTFNAHNATFIQSRMDIKEKSIWHWNFVNEISIRILKNIFGQKWKNKFFFWKYFSHLSSCLNFVLSKHCKTWWNYCKTWPTLELNTFCIKYNVNKKVCGFLRRNFFSFSSDSRLSVL